MKTVVQDLPRLLCFGEIESTNKSWQIELSKDKTNYAGHATFASEDAYPPVFKMN